MRVHVWIVTLVTCSSEKEQGVNIVKSFVLKLVEGYYRGFRRRLRGILDDLWSSGLMKELKREVVEK